MIDAVSTWVATAASWLVLAVCAVAAGHALLTKLFNIGSRSNAWLELQWLMFSSVFLLCAPWTLLRNEHIRIDIINHHLSPRIRNAIEIAGHALFLLPMAGLVVWTSLPFALASYGQGEGSSNFGGLPQWPLKMLIPLAFALLFAQGVSELIKRVAILRGDVPAPDEPPAAAAARNASDNDRTASIP